MPKECRRSWHPPYSQSLSICSMPRCMTCCPAIYAVLVIILAFAPLSVSAAGECQDIAVHVEYGQPLPDDDIQVHLTLLDDAADLQAQFTALQEESKPTLEPLIQRYMLAVERLSRLAPEQAEARRRLHQQAAEAEDGIQATLTAYRRQLDALLDEAALRRQSCASLTEACVLSGAAPGAYRLYAEVAVATTRLRWFEPLTITKGGDALSVRLTRDNLQNPYWTDLNWWRFLNLDFSKHH